MLLPVEACIREGGLKVLPDRMALPGPDDEVLGLLLLEDPPHALEVLRVETPVHPGIQGPYVEGLLFAGKDSGDPARDLPRHERLAPPGGFVVEENPVCGKHPITVAVIPRHPVGIEFGAGVRAPRPERCRLALRRRRRPEHLAARSLVELRPVSAPPDHLKKPGRPEAGDVSRVLGDIEANPHVTLGPEVVDFVGFDVVDEMRDLLVVGEVAVVKIKLCARIVRIGVDVIDPGSVEGRCSPDDPVHLIALVEEKLSEVGAVLPGDAGY